MSSIAMTWSSSSVLLVVVLVVVLVRARSDALDATVLWILFVVLVVVSIRYDFVVNRITRPI